MPGRKTRPDELLALSRPWTPISAKPPKRPKSASKLGAAPNYLEPDEAEIWREIDFYAPAHVLTGADRTVVEILCRLSAKMRRREPVTGTEIGMMLRATSLLGMTPVDRARLAPVEPEKKAADPFSEFSGRS